MPYNCDPAVAVPKTKYQGLIMYRDVIEPYMPSRVVRQLGRVQSIPLPIMRPDKQCRAANTRKYKVKYSTQSAIDQWRTFPISSFIAINYFPSAMLDPAGCTNDYMRWYGQCSHPFVLNGVKGDVRHSRENTDYWVNRFGALTRDSIEYLKDGGLQEAASDITERFEEIMREFREYQ